MTISEQVSWLFILALPVACISWTVVFEEVFREPREYFVTQCKTQKNGMVRKFFYLFTCEYCFSHYIAILFIILADYQLLIDDWRGYIIGGFALVWVANLYMSLFQLLRQGIKKEKTEIKLMEKDPAIRK